MGISSLAPPRTGKTGKQGRPPSSALTVRVCQALMAQAERRRQAERDGQVGCVVWVSGPGSDSLQRQADREAGG